MVSVELLRESALRLFVHPQVYIGTLIVEYYNRHIIERGKDAAFFKDEDTPQKSIRKIQ